MKSVFESMKKDICEKIMTTKSMTELFKLLGYINEEYNLEEEK